MTTVASILAMLLDQAFHAKGQFSIREPVKFFRDKYLQTEWKKDYAWRPFLDPLIIGLGDQQLITGSAVLLSGWIKVAQNDMEVQGARFVLILHICALSSSSHLAALITLRKYFDKYKLIAKIRMTMVIIFSIVLLCSMIASITMPGSVVVEKGDIVTKQRVHRLAFLVPMVFILIGFSTALACILYKPERSGLAHRTSDLSGKSIMCILHTMAGPSKGSLTVPKHIAVCILFLLFLNPLIAFMVQIILMALSTVLVLSQKLAKPDDTKLWCGLENPAENAWEFGQTLSMLMLFLPVMSAGQAYLEGRQHIVMGEE